MESSEEKVKRRLSEDKAWFQTLYTEKNKVVLTLSSAAFAYMASVFIDLKKKGIVTDTLEHAILLVLAAIILHLLSLFCEMCISLWNTTWSELILEYYSELESEKKLKKIQANIKSLANKKEKKELSNRVSKLQTNFGNSKSTLDKYQNSKIMKCTGWMMSTISILGNFISVLLLIRGLWDFYSFITKIQFPI